MNMNYEIVFQVAMGFLKLKHCAFRPKMKYFFTLKIRIKLDRLILDL